MKSVKEFLEISTIHGLVHISQCRRRDRIFWVAVVLAGFSYSYSIIHESLLSWAQSPASTTIETLPISQVSFPSVTVCPPAQTATTLNYDLARLSRGPLQPNISAAMARLVPEWIQDEEFKKASRELQLFAVSDKYRNWYRGLARVSYLFH